MKYEKEIRRQPTEVSRLLSSPHSHALDLNRPIRLVGIGTSLHACRVAEYWIRVLSNDTVNVRAEEAHPFAFEGNATRETQIVVVSHCGTKRFPNEVLLRASYLGCDTVCVTSDSDATPMATIILRTCTPDLASTHTVSYTSALAVLAQLIMNSFGTRSEDLQVALSDVVERMELTLRLPIPPETIENLERAQRVLVTGYGIDAITADEAALKIKEGTYKWTESLTTEFALHGPPAAYDKSLHALIIDPHTDEGERSETLRNLIHQVNATESTIGLEGTVPTADCHPLARPFVVILPFQRIVLDLARKLGSNPDMIRTDTKPWSDAMTSFQL